ncbi:MAG: glycosyltransferase family 4 protein [Candidatus Bathyarchaeia archaeon]|jgi:glycosyltransferase involved in cell wall biosynthesis
MVYYCSVKHSSRKWDLWPRNYDYEYKILPRIPLRTPLGDQSLNLSIIKELILNKPHVLILSDYTEPTIWLALAVAKLLKIPLIYWTEGIKEPQSILGRISRPLRALFVKKSGSIIVPGRLSRNYVISLGADPEKVFIAPNAIDNKLFVETSGKYVAHKNQLRDQLGFKDKVLILYIGQLIERKGVKYLLNAYAKIKKEYPNVALLVLGSGPSESNLRKLANSIELRDFRIIQSGSNLKKLITLYSIADIFVLPTLEDVWGFVINEAMVCGLPVVSTYASQAACEMVRSGINGYAVNAESSEELYVALKELICNVKRRKEMGQQSRDIVNNEFDVRHMAEGFVQAVNHVTSN